MIWAPALNHKINKFSTFRGFLKSFSLRSPEVDGRTKDWITKRLLHGTLRLRNSPTGEQIQNGRTMDEIPRDPITPWCGSPLFYPCFSLTETSVIISPFVRIFMKWSGLWTCPPWVVCAPAFNHKIKKFCSFPSASEIVFFKKPRKWTEELRIG